MKTTVKNSSEKIARWLIRLFVASIATLVGIAVVAVATGKLGGYLMMAGFLYTALCAVFLGVIFFVFVYGHVASSEEIENPKIDLFELEKRQ